MTQSVRAATGIAVASLVGLCVGLAVPRDDGTPPIARSSTASTDPPVGAVSAVSAATWKPVFSETVQLPSGDLRIESEVLSAFPLFDKTYSRLSQPQRTAVINNALTTVAGAEREGWPLSTIARRDGPFHIKTVVVSALARYFTRVVPDNTPRRLRLPRKLNRPLTIKVFGSLERLRATAGNRLSAEHTNGYFSARTNEIGIALDPSLTDYLYPPSAYQLDVGELAGQAFDATRRTFLVPLFHELSHALQSASMEPLFLAPIFSEGQAVYEASRLEREEILLFLVGRQATEFRGSYSFANDVIAIRTGTVLLPSEYGRLCRMRRVFTKADGHTLERALLASRDGFSTTAVTSESVQGCEAPVGPQLNYDLAWTLIYSVHLGKISERTFAALADTAMALAGAEHLPQLANVERGIRDLTGRTAPDVMPADYGNRLAAAVSAQDRAAEEQRYFDGYRAFVPLLRADPTVPLLLSYVGDMFWQVDLRDMFFFYYDQAALKESAKGATKMAGRFRLTSRYVDALWSLGHYQAATDRLAENELTTLDTLALLRMNLRFKFVDQANKSGWQQDNLRRLERELELGERILSLARLRSRDLRAELMGQAANDKERAQVEVLAAFVDRNAERLREEVRTELARQGFSALKERPWFLLDYQIVDNPIDLKALIDTP